MRLPARRLAVVVAVGAVLVGLGAGAFACTNLATLILSNIRGRPGMTVTVTGASFAFPRPSTGLAPTPVVLHWQSEQGPVLAQADPDRFGAISASFTVPEAKPGFYVITATQETLKVPVGAAADAPVSRFAEVGTPARASFEVVSADGTPVLRAPTPSVEPVQPGAGDYDATVWVVLTAAFGAIAVSLFGGGLVAFVYQTRQSKVPAEARWVPPGWYS